MKHRLICCVVASALLWQISGVQAKLPPLIPRAVLFGNPDKASPKISPDGKRLAYLAPDEGVLNVWVRTIGEHDDRPVTKNRGRGVRYYFWAHNNKQILYDQDKDGDQNWHLYGVDLTTNKTRDLTPFEGVQARVLAVKQEFPNEILVGINNRVPQHHDVYRIDLTTGRSTLEFENKDGLIGFIPDQNLQIRAALNLTKGGGVDLVVRESSESAWRILTTWGPEDTLTSGPVAFTPDDNGLYVLSSAGSNTTELRRMNLETGTEKRLASDRQADVADLFIHPAEHTIQAVAFNKEKLRWKVLDKSVKRDFAAIKRIHRGDFKIINRDHADRTWLVSFTTDNGPVSYYVYDRDTREAELLFTSRKALETVRLAKMEPISFKACDGLTVHGYLSTPPGIKARNLPTVLYVRAAPWGRDSWGYHGTVQWLANRGYAVLQINFRGSRGYGKHFLNAANREWGGNMHCDLVDGVNWVIGKGIADPKRIAIFGSLYGGYSALVGLAFTPDVFCCGVDMSGPSNLITFLKELPPYLKPFEPLLWDRIGDPDKDAAFLMSRSPLFSVDRIKAPLLICQGANDPTVKRSESVQIVEALKKAGKTVEYIEYANEGHGFARPENRLDFFGKAEKFLAKHLGGRYEE